MLISIKANCIDSTAPPEQVFAQEVEKLRSEKFFPKEQLTLEPYERDHAVSHIPLRLAPTIGNTDIITVSRWCQQFTGKKSSKSKLMVPG